MSSSSRKHYLSDTTVRFPSLASLPSWVFFIVFLLWGFIAIIAIVVYSISSKGNPVLGYVPVGFLVVVFALRIIYKKPGEKLRIKRGKSIFIGLFAGCILGITGIAVYVYDGLNNEVVRDLYSPIVKMREGSNNDGFPYIYCLVGQDTLEFRIPYRQWKSLDVGDTMHLRVYEGALGFKFAYEVVLVSNQE
jgi:predicted membrane channel-forming protein YqfA (hemolysin III family)